jgi:RNA 2',3'-cyclic 3'-phosphodiesterase
MRLFVAVDLDDDVRHEVGEVIARMRASIGKSRATRVSWVAPDQLHLTLHFLGSVEPATAARVIEAVAEPIDQPPFRITFEGLGTFPAHGRPNVIWLGVGQGRESLIELHALVESRLKATGVQLERRPFSPHLTLARVKQMSGRAPTREGKWGLSPSLVDRVTLYESQLGAKGAMHIKVATGLLGSRGRE